MRQPDLIAHRGYPLHFPENSLPGIEAALSAGAEFIEIDVQLTADLVPVVFHDRTLERLCGEPGAIHERDLADLGRLAVRGPLESERARIPTLAEVVALCRAWPRVTLFVEIKRVALERFGILDVYRRVTQVLDPLHARAVLISFDLEVLLVARWNGWPALGAVIEHWSEREDPLVTQLAPEYLFCDVAGLPDIGELRWPGARLAVYEVADPLLARMLAARGADLVETFAVAEMLAAMEDPPRV